METEKRAAFIYKLNLHVCIFINRLPVTNKSNPFACKKKPKKTQKKTDDIF